MSDGEVLFAPSKRLSSIQPVTASALIKKTRPSKIFNGFSKRNKVWWSLIGSFTVKQHRNIRVIEPHPFENAARIQNSEIIKDF